MTDSGSEEEEGVKGLEGAEGGGAELTGAKEIESKQDHK